jgi:hypothetical protein
MRGAQLLIALPADGTPPRATPTREKTVESPCNHLTPTGAGGPEDMSARIVIGVGRTAIGAETDRSRNR